MTGTASGYSVSVILPARNEEPNIEKAVRRAIEVAERLFTGYEVIVVDDGSTDDTAALVSELARGDERIRLVQHPRNRGYGEALRSGFRQASKDLVFFTDADNQFDLDELERLVPFVDRVDAVVGYRHNRQDSPGRLLLARGWNYLVRLVFFVPVRDIDCAFKLFRRDVLTDLDIDSVGAMVNTELMVKLARSGHSVVEVPVTHLPRTAGVARGANPRVVAKAIRELIVMYRKIRAAERPGPQ